jgi:hypothetical protein
MMTLDVAIVAACFASAASAFRAFLWASFSARFRASTESDDVAASRASTYISIHREGRRKNDVPADHICS